MEQKIKSVEIVNKKEFARSLNDKFENVDKLFNIFEETVGKNKWTYIPNKNLYFNKKIMGCYPNFLTNFQNIQIDRSIGYNAALKKIYENIEYSKYGINWDIQTEGENRNSFYWTWHPMESDSNHRIRGYYYFIIKKDHSIHTFYNEPNGGSIDGSSQGLLIPIFRLLKKEVYDEIGDSNFELNYPLEEIFKIFLDNKLIIKDIYSNNKLTEEFEKLSEYSKYIKEIVKRDDKAEIIWNLGRILNEVLERENSLFEKLDIKFIYSDESEEIKTYKNGKAAGETTQIYKNGDKEVKTYTDGIVQGDSKYFYQNGNIEERKYADGVIQGDAVIKNPEGKIISHLQYTDGTKKDITKLYNILHIDEIRVNLDVYDENILTDPNRGHWDLFENESKEEIQNSFGRTIYARDPRLDIKKGGIVGIDFGTKSTVVVFQDDKNITLPMRISGNKLNKEAESSDYENPTVIEFVDIKEFMKDYESKEGRPFTSWEDITVSHTAFQKLFNAVSSSQYSSTISDLKQWAGSKKYNMVVKDAKNTEEVFKPYLELKEGDIDPIELYAYYIGSYINNLKNGVYLEYFLSFPVTYEKAIRKKILESFERGIKKSLPETILKDKNIMKKFKVKHGANEPAAYSVCALQEYGFEPEEEEKIYYGVFDFGGGTLDFDFGIWRSSEDERSYDFDLEHFGAGGDRYLGGENILKEMAFEVFKDNQKILREKNISFYRPEWCDKFMGDESLVDESQEAKLNIKVLMEKLRGLWEKNKTEDYSEPKLKVGLFDKKGIHNSKIELDFDKEKLEKLIADKIKGGIDNFFIAMEKAFKNEEYDKIYILLAGNSCKHPLVKEIFENTIKEKNINAEILPALGTEEAYAKLQELGVEYNKNDNRKPTGKTGVAYGIIASRTGGRINIINRDESGNENNEINFKYYIGYESRKKFKPVLTPQTGYNNFVWLLNATADVFDLYYSSVPEASEGKMPIEKARKERVTLEKEYGDGEKIYIRAISADTIEYVVAKTDVTEKDYLEQGTITLN